MIIEMPPRLNVYYLSLLFHFNFHCTFSRDFKDYYFVDLILSQRQWQQPIVLSAAQLKTNKQHVVKQWRIFPAPCSHIHGSKVEKDKANCPSGRFATPGPLCYLPRYVSDVNIQLGFWRLIRVIHFGCHC